MKAAQWGLKQRLVGDRLPANLDNKLLARRLRANDGAVVAKSLCSCSPKIQDGLRNIFRIDPCGKDLVLPELGNSVLIAWIDAGRALESGPRSW